MQDTAHKISINVKTEIVPTLEELQSLYEAVQWSSAKKPEQLYKAMQNSHTVVTAYYKEELIGLANAISDGALVVYFPHLLIHPDYQRKGIGKRLIEVLLKKYEGFHQQVLIADNNAVNFYTKNGFKLATNTTSLWIYEGNDH